MAFIESPRFPSNIAYGSSGGPTYLTEVVRMNSGREKRNARWANPLHQYPVVFQKGQLEAYAVLEFFNTVRGRWNGFRYKDHQDYKSTEDMSQAIAATDQVIGTGDGSTTQFQLIKTYVEGSESTARKIQKPVSGAVLIALNSVPQASGWSVDTTTGIVTFTSAPSGSVTISAGYEFDVPVRFDEDQLQLRFEDLEAQSANFMLFEIRV